MDSPKILDSGALLAEDNEHRYTLWRTWDYNKPRILFIGLNPSRATATYTDPTIGRVIRFAADWGYGSLYFGNLYSFRTPYVTQAQADKKRDIEERWEPLIPNLHKAHNGLTDAWLKKMMLASEKTVCCWGSWPFIKKRADQVLTMIKYPMVFGLNKDGQPTHPLYLPAKTELIPWNIDVPREKNLND